MSPQVGLDRRIGLKHGAGSRAMRELIRKVFAEGYDAGAVDGFGLDKMDDGAALRIGDRWKGHNDEGFQIAVAYWEEPEPEEDESRRRRNDDPRLVLTEVESLMRKTVDEQGFKELLKARGMSVADFVDLVRTVRERDRRNAEERIINALLPPEMDRDD